MADIAGPLLVRAGLITQAQLVLAQTGRSRSGGTVSEHLVAQGALDEEQLCNFYRQRLLVPRVGRAELSRIAPHVIRRVPADMAAEFRVVPYEVDRDQSLIIAMAEPSDTHAIDEIGFFTGCFVMRAVAPASAIAWALGHFYGVPSSFAATPPAPMIDERSGAVIVDRPPPLDLRAHPVVVPGDASATPEELRQAAKRQQAVIVEDVYDEDTPLPRPIPFDTTGQMPRIDLAAPPTPTPAPAPTPDAVPTAIPDDPSTHTIPNPVPPMPRRSGSRPTTKPPAEPWLTAPPAEAAPPTIDTERALAVALERLQFASDRDGIAIALVSYLSILCRRAALFVVRKGALCGWVGKGEGVYPDDLRRAALALDVPSTFRDVVNTRLPFRGPVTDSRSRDLLIDALGWAPDDVIALPITLRDKVVSVLYGDGFQVQVPDEHLARIAREASEGLERALAAKKGG